ncbi:tetratricopeptide repeat protein [Sphingobacteriaceae bacterium AH-315-L07]|nr:tetratricopeptide repeat protein [Sphingobacteriaceae bacterium AH-315-L07]
MLLVCFSNKSLSQDKTDSLKAELTKAKDDTTRINLLNTLGWQLMYQNPDSAIVLVKQALKLAERIGHKKGIAKANNSLGAYYSFIGNYPLSLSHNSIALDLRKQLNDKTGIASSLSNIGLVYCSKGDYPKALKHYFEALEIDEELGDKNGIAIDLSHIGTLYSYQKDYSNALKHYFEALDIDKELENKYGIARLLGNIGNIYNLKRDYTNALKYYFEALDIDKELENKDGIARHLGNIGIVYDERDDHHNALKYYFEALNISKELGKKGAIASNFLNIGSLYTEQKKYKEAEKYLIQALEISKEIGEIRTIKETAHHLSELYIEKNNYQLALQYFKEAMAAKDSIFNETSSKQIAGMQARYEAEKKEKELEILDAENKVNDEELDNRKYKQYAIGGGFAIVLILLTMVASRFWDKTKVANLLYETNTDLVNKSYELEQKKTELQNLSLVANETHNSVIIADTMGEIQWVNGGFERMSGFTMDEFKKTRGRTLMEVSANPNFSQLLSDCINKKESMVYESLNETKDGTKTWVQSTLTPVVGKDGVLNDIVVIDTDITNLKNTLLKVAEKDKDITDSINYASRIQESILIPIEEIQKSYPDCFIIHKQSKTVGGLAYFYHQVNHLHYFATIDCKHKGVPGAFMTMLVTDLLNNIFVETETPKPNEILSSLNSKLKTIKKSSLDKELGFDNIEVNFCCVDVENNKVDLSQKDMASIKFCENGKLIELKEAIEKEIKNKSEVLVIGIGNVNVTQ